MGIKVVAYGESHSLDTGRFVPLENAKELLLEVSVRENIAYLPALIGSMVDHSDRSLPLSQYLDSNANNTLGVFIIAHALNILSGYETEFEEQDKVAIFTFYRVIVEGGKAYLPCFVGFLEPESFDGNNPVLPPEAWKKWYRKHSAEQLDSYDKHSAAWERVNYVTMLANADLRIHQDISSIYNELHWNENNN